MMFIDNDNLAINFKSKRIHWSSGYMVVVYSSNKFGK